jgi:hypothetical protein
MNCDDERRSTMDTRSSPRRASRTWLAVAIGVLIVAAVVVYFLVYSGGGSSAGSSGGGSSGGFGGYAIVAFSVSQLAILRDRYREWRSRR